MSFSFNFSPNPFKNSPFGAFGKLAPLPFAALPVLGVLGALIFFGLLCFFSSSSITMEFGLAPILYSESYRFFKCVFILDIISLHNLGRSYSIWANTRNAEFLI